MLLDKDGKELSGWDVQGLTSAEKDLISVFLQGAVYCWCNVHKGEPFQARNLIGESNRNWRGTPLQKVYDKHHGDDAYSQAATDAGKLLKTMLVNDTRCFILEDEKSYPLTYHWDGKTYK